MKGTSILARTSSTSSNGERKKHSSQNYWSTSSSFYLWELQQLTSFGFSMRYWTKDCLNWPCWILIPFTISSCSDKAWNIQFPDPWLSEILRPLSDTIVVNSSVKVVLLLTVLAQSCIRWRFWIVRSSSPRTKIIFSEFPWIIQCRWKGRFQLWQRKNHIKDRIFSSPWIFFNPLRTPSVSPWQAAWNLYMIWIGPNSLLVKKYPPKSGARATLIQSGTSLFYEGRCPQMNEIFPYQLDHVGKNISWEHKLLFF